MTDFKYDFKELMKDPFFARKFKREAEIRDIDKDGFIIRADFTVIAQRHAEMGTPEHKVKELREMMNRTADSMGLTDDNIKLTYEEFGMSWENEIKEMGEDKAQFAELFHAVDLNNDGAISYEEWARHYQAMGIDTKHARASFDAMDTNGDKEVSKQEFIDYHYEYYYTNKDELKSSLLNGPLE